MTVSFVQSASDSSVDTYTNVTVTLGAAPTEGNLLVAALAVRSGGGNAGYGPFTGWTHLETAFCTSGGLGGDHAVDLYYKVAGPSESASITSPSVGSHQKDFTVMEFAGVAGLDTSDAISVQAGPTVSVGPLTPSAAAEVLIVGAICQNTTVDGYTPGSGFVEVRDVTMPGPFQPNYLAEYRIVASPTGSYSATATAPNSADWGGIVAFFSGAVLPPGIYIDWDDD